VSGYALGRGAESDLDAIWEYIAQDDVDPDDRWIAKLFDAFEAAGQTPGMGPARADLTPSPLLFGSIDTYVVIYRAQGRPVEIVAFTLAGYPGVRAADVYPAND
jgi:plasmid stabilization system protein ParE